jgi:hypothetical protein
MLFVGPCSAEPAAIDFTSGLRHTFLDTGDLLRALHHAVIFKPQPYGHIECLRQLPLPDLSGDGCHQAFRGEVVQQLPKLLLALCRLHLIFVEKRVA